MVVYQCNDLGGDVADEGNTELKLKGYWVKK